MILQHMNSRRHADDYASDDDISDDTSSYDSDSDSSDGDPYCDGCERQFVNMTSLNQHLFNSPKHNWCFDCSRDFSSESSLLQVSRVYGTFSPTQYSDIIRSTKTLLPIVNAISNVLSVAGCSRVPLVSPSTSNRDATKLPATR